MKRILPTLSRLLILAVILGGGFLLFSSQTTSLKLPSQFSAISNVTNSINTDKIEGFAKEKFVDQQPILSEEKPKTVVLGESTGSMVSDQAKQILNKTTEIVSTELKNLPKKEAAKILRQTCEQVALDLEK